MRWKTRVLPGGLLFLFAALAAWRICSPPTLPDGMFRCLPQNARAAVAVRDPRKNLDRLLQHPLADALCAGEGADRAAWRTLDPAMLGLIGELCGDRAVAAWAPAADGRSDPFWSAATAPGGWRSVFVRFLLWIRYLPGLGRLHPAGDGVGVVRLPGPPLAGEPLALAMRDGVLMAALGTGAETVMQLRRRLVFADRPPPVFAGDAPWEESGTETLSVWVSGRALPGSLRARIDAWDEAEDALRLRVRLDGLELPPMTNAWTGGVERLVEPLPFEGSAALLAVSGAVAARLAEAGLVLPGALGGAEAPDWMAAHVSVRPYEGRLLGISMPALSLRWRRKAPLDLPEIDRWIDATNRRFRLGLIRRGVDANGGRFETLLDSRLPGGGRLGRDESCGRLAWESDGTVELATSAGSSRRQAAAGGDPRIRRLGRELDARAAASGMLAGGWISGGPAARALRDAFAVHRLMAMMHQVGESPVPRAAVSAVADVLEAIDRFGPLLWSVRIESPTRLSAELRLNPPAETPRRP